VVAASELTDPVAYSRWWLVLAVLLPLVVVAWYAGVRRWVRTRSPLSQPPHRGIEELRIDTHERLDRVEAAVARGDMTLRAAHQSISEIVRSFVADAGSVDARVMDLEQLRHSTADDVVDLIELVYPPAFAPGDEGQPQERLAPALREARELVATWRP
jgi:hypothetical protein